MKILSYRDSQRTGLALERGGAWLDLKAGDAALPDDIALLLALPDWAQRVDAAAKKATPIDIERIEFLPPLRMSQKILCVGLNYIDHVHESPYGKPDYPAYFPRVASSLIGNKAPILKPFLSDDLDFEGELVAVIGKQGRHIPAGDALSYVAGYTVFNEGSLRDYQFKSPQWTMGKNFDNTGACGPWFVTADELPPGAKGLTLETRINGKVEQHASTNDMIFDVATLVSLASQVMTLRPGDMFVTGTPAGVGFGKNPKTYLRAGDLCEVSIEGIGTLTNKVENEVVPAHLK